MTGCLGELERAEEDSFIESDCFGFEARVCFEELAGAGSTSARYSIRTWALAGLLGDRPHLYTVRGQVGLRLCHRVLT